MTSTQYDKKINKIHSELKQKWDYTNKMIAFCLEHKFDIEANVLRKVNDARYDAIMSIEIEFNTK